MMQKSLSLREIESALNVSYQTLMQWLRDGSISGEKIPSGRREVWRIPAQEVERIREDRINSLQKEIDKLRNISINGIVFSARSRDEWPDSSLSQWGDAVKRRDGWTCQNCGTTVKETGTQKLHAHHIVPTRQGGKNTLANGVTLCSTCHAATHRAMSDKVE